MVQPIQDKKILLALQYWKGDQAQAMRLARFIADLQPRHSERADFLFVSRFDCPQDQETIQYVSRKFNVMHYRSARRGVGWPIGCNELWFGTMEKFCGLIELAKVPEYKSILTFEADCVPLSTNWINHLSNEWDRLNVIKPTFVAGALLDAPGEHINGNGMFSADKKFLTWVTKKVGGCPSRTGWDYYLAKAFKEWGWGVMPGLVSEWHTKSYPPERFEHDLHHGVVFFHGVKDDSLLKLSRANLLR